WGEGSAGLAASMRECNRPGLETSAGGTIPVRSVLERGGFGDEQHATQNVDGLRQRGHDWDGKPWIWHPRCRRAGLSRAQASEDLQRRNRHGSLQGADKWLG